MKNKEIEESINRIKSIVDFYKLNDENNYDYSDDVLISMKILLSYIEQLEKDKKELEERYNLVCKISEERKNKWLSLNEENEILFNTLKKYKLECESNGKIIHQLQNNRDKAIEYMQDFIFEPLLVQEDRKLIMYNENLRNFEKILKGGSDENK